VALWRDGLTVVAIETDVGSLHFCTVGANSTARLRSSCKLPIFLSDFKKILYFVDRFY
jgi:hypothetical protein